MEKTAIGTNDLGMHIVIRPILKDLLSKDEIVGMETGKINSLLTARRPITFVDAISALPPLLPSSADPITGRRLYSVNEIMSGSCGIHFGPPVPELLRYETELSANTVLESSIASARSAAKRIPCNGQWLTDVLGNADPDSTMVAVETFADWSMARSVIFLVAKLLGFLAAGSDTPMKDTGFTRYYVERLDKTLWCIPFAFNPFFSSGKRGCRLLTDKLTDYRSYQQLASILTHREKIGDFEPKISMPKYSDPPLMKRAERPLSLHRLFLPRNMQVYSMGGTTKQKGTICFVRKLAVLSEVMRKIS